MNWEGMITPAVATAVLAAVTGLGAKAWQLIQQGRLDCLERCAALTLDLRTTETERDTALAKLEASNQRLLQTSMTLERLLGKYERELERISSRPPKST